ncbi:MAG TPA: DUF490 domain-containing protein, partial [Flavobacterium sp.]|nr:DUF490 domain-containing protein [Flavobacterium sp.]
MSLPWVQTKLGKYATDYLNKEFGTKLSIEKVEITIFGNIKLKNVVSKDINNINLFTIKDLKTSIASYVDFKKLIDQGHPYFDFINADELELHILQNKGEKQSNLDQFIDAFDDGKPGSGKFRMLVQSINITNSKFTYTDYNLQTPKVLNLKNLNAKLIDFKIKGSDVTTNINSLVFDDHRGLKIKRLISKFTYTKTNIILDELDLKTAHSTLKGKIKLNYTIKD